MKRIRPVVLLLIALTAISSAYCQRTVPPPAAQATTPAAPPATKMEGFKPADGSVVTFGYDDLGRVGAISVDVRELSDSKGTTVRGLLVEVVQGEYRDEKSFVDADEIPELLKGFDALLAVSVNPTSFKNFEVRYTTHGGLQLTAFNDNRGRIEYAVQAGEFTKAQSLGLSSGDMQKLKGLFEAAEQKIEALQKKHT